MAPEEFWEACNRAENYFLWVKLADNPDNLGDYFPSCYGQVKGIVEKFIDGWENPYRSINSLLINASYHVSTKTLYLG